MGYLWTGEEVRGRGQRYALFRHTVDTTEVAALSDADAKIVMLAREGISKES